MSLDPKSTYYDAGGIETIEVIKAKLTPEQYRGFCHGNALKYLMRAEHKEDPMRDFEKAHYYIKLWMMVIGEPDVCKDCRHNDGIGVCNPTYLTDCALKDMK